MAYYDSSTGIFNKTGSVVSSDEFSKRNRATWIMLHARTESEYMQNKAIVESIHALWLQRNLRVMSDLVNHYEKWHKGYNPRLMLDISNSDVD